MSLNGLLELWVKLPDSEPFTVPIAPNKHVYDLWIKMEQFSSASMDFKEHAFEMFLKDSDSAPIDPRTLLVNLPLTSASSPLVFEPTMKRMILLETRKDKRGYFIETGKSLEFEFSDVNQFERIIGIYEGFVNSDTQHIHLHDLRFLVNNGKYYRVNQCPQIFAL